VRPIRWARSPLLSSDDMSDPNLGGFAVQRELVLLVQAGLTPYRAMGIWRMP